MQLHREINNLLHFIHLGVLHQPPSWLLILIILTAKVETCHKLLFNFLVIFYLQFLHLFVKKCTNVIVEL